MAVEWNKLTIAKLKDELSSRGLDVTGKKGELIKRILEHDKILEEEALLEQDETEKDMDDQEAATNEDEVLDDPDIKPEIDADNQEETTEISEDVQMKEETEDVKPEISDATEEQAETGDVTEETNAPEEAAVSVNAGPEDDDEMQEVTFTITGIGSEDKSILDEAVEEPKEAKEGEEKKDEKDEEEKEDDKQSHKKKDIPRNIEGKIIYLPWHGGGTVVVPVREQIRHDLAIDSRKRTVVVYPITLDDLGNEQFKNYMEKAISFQVTFQHEWQFKEKVTDGSVEFHFRTCEEADEMAEEMKGFKEDFHVKRSDAEDERARLVQKWSGQGKSREPIGDRLLVFGPLPLDTTEDELHAFFTDAHRVVVAVDSKGQAKGYGYAEYTTEKEMKSAIDKYKTAEFRGEKLFVYKVLRDRPTTLLSTKDFRQAMQAIRQSENMMKNQGRMLNQFQRQNILETKRDAKAQLARDLETRERMGLPLRLSQIKEKERLEKREQEIKEAQEKRKAEREKREKEREERHKKREEERKARKEAEAAEKDKEKSSSGKDEEESKDKDADDKDADVKDEDEEEPNIFELMKSEEKEKDKSEEKSSSRRTPESKRDRSRERSSSTKKSEGRDRARDRSRERERERNREGNRGRRDNWRDRDRRDRGNQGRQAMNWSNQSSSSMGSANQRSVSMGTGSLMGSPGSLMGQGGMGNQMGINQMGMGGGAQTEQAFNMLMGLSNVLRNQMGGAQQQGYSQQSFGQQQQQQQQGYGGGWNAGGMSNQQQNTWGNKRGGEGGGDGANWKRQRRR